MTVPAVDTALDVANWFFKRAEKDGGYLDDDKLHHLMFLAAVHFTVTNHGSYLYPALFAAVEEGFVEPNLRKTLSFGRPLMAAPAFQPPINSFLELIWKKYSPLNPADLTEFIKNSAGYREYFQSGHTNLVELDELGRRFKQQLKGGASPSTTTTVSGTGRSKVLISQNGPVVVSDWQPRKLNTQNQPQENIHA